MRLPIGAALSTVLLFSLAAGARAQIGASVPNWAVPATGPSGSPGMRTQAGATSLVPFIGVTPCRIVDTRGPAGPFGAPSLAPGSPRNFSLFSGPCPGIPSAVAAYSLNITVTNTQGAGDLRVYPQGGAAPLVSTVNYVLGQTVANAAIVPAGTGGGITVVADVHGTNLIIDINGYFSPTPGLSTESFLVSNASHYAISGQTSSAGLNDAGIYGLAASTIGVVDGVWGQSNSNSDFGIGVLGTEVGTSGVTYGVYGRSVSSTDGAAGVYGESSVANGATIGVEGVAASDLGTGVVGIGPAGAIGGTNAEAGIRGEDKFVRGVVGLSEGQGVAGLVYNSGTLDAGGSLGDRIAPGGPWGVLSLGNMGATGTKPFLEVHPTDPNKVIRYVALEGPEAGTYFRGSEEIRDGTAVIPVPESFRHVTDKEGLTVQITPIGAPAVIYVVAKDLDRIVVRSDRDVKFDYLVQGVRQTFKDWQVMVDGGYMPESPEQRLPRSFSDEQKRRLIANGTYNADGTVNMATAERVGWTRIWADRDARRAAAVEEARKAAVQRRSAMMR